ncbi:AsmA family protein [Bartonella sp. F02]|uniref:AsmA family protein n=1 Tax=Bartonella sp. F02 TaxID=2967262 RepID=UPI0022A9D3A1|nr:AsmA family protein [Bartonella sp. F02]MCZ2328913.1 AsmA family protein [Bartonella sp. F02]
MRIEIINCLSKIFITIIFLCGSAVIILPYIVSTDAIRVRLAQDLSAWTGYNVQLRDLPQLNIFPYPKAVLSGVTLTSEIDDVSPLMEAESIEVDLSLIDLLRGRISFSETRIVRPRFVMIKPVKTAADFLDTFSRSQGSLGLAVRRAREMVQNNSDQSNIEHLLNQPFGRIVIENGVLIYHNGVSGIAERVTGINATLDWPELTQAVRFRAKARWHGELTELLINADQALLLFAGGKSSLKVSFNSIRGGITFIGQARLTDHYIFDGKLLMRSPGWNQTLAWIGRNLWGHHLKIPIVWESHFLAQSTHIRMDNIIFSIGAANARGALELDFQNHIPTIIGSLGFDNLDFNLFESIFSSIKNENKFFDIMISDHIGLDVRLSAAQAKIKDVSLENLAATIQIRNGYGIFDLGNANVFGGSVQSNIQIAQEDGEKIRIEGRASGTSVDMQSLLNFLGFSPFIQDKTNFIATTKILTDCWPKNFMQMQGQLTLNISSGQLLGYDLNDLQNKLLENKQFFLANNNMTSIAFDRLNIKAKFANGAITVKELFMHMADWNLLLQGIIAISDTQGKEHELTLQARLQKNNRSETLCKDVQCLTNSLMQPFVFSLNSTGQNIGNFFVNQDKEYFVRNAQ